jgi:hypothetical protein
VRVTPPLPLRVALQLAFITLNQNHTVSFI